LKHILPSVLAAALVLASPAVAQDTKRETPKLRLAVGGKSAVFYLPLSVTERVDYFKDAGLDVEIFDVASGARALQSIVGGTSVDAHLTGLRRVEQAGAQLTSIPQLLCELQRDGTRKDTVPAFVKLLFK
jgi:hypothetical protein